MMHGEGTLHIAGKTLQGSWSNGVPDFAPPRDGYKRFVFPDGKGIYEGYWKDRKRHGQGTFIFENNDKYEGEWFMGEMNGVGKYHHSNGDTYEGEFRNGRMHGRGTYAWGSIRQCYVGEWQEGVRHGAGTHYFASDAPGAQSEYYEGGWREGVMWGEGKYVDADGSVHLGTWEKGVCPEIDFNAIPDSGQFRYQFQGGTYEGQWANRMPHGKGRMVYADGTVYEGEWKEFQFHGQGRLVHSNGVMYEGEWQHGRQHGQGRAAPI